MPTFHAPDGTALAYDVVGDGEPVVVLPGGPMRDPAYLGDLGGLARHRAVAVLHLRGTGRSEVPRDPASVRCDRQVADVEALRDHLGLERVDVLGHSAGANLALQLAAAHPDHVRRLVLVTPSARAVGLEVPGEAMLEVARQRAHEPWFATAWAALERTTGGAPEPGDDDATAPFFHGRWDDAAREHSAASSGQMDDAAAAAFRAPGAFDPPATCAGLARFEGPALVLAGEVDPVAPPSVVRDLVALLPAGRLSVQPGAGHYPWLDDADAFTAAVSAFLSLP